jgi:hypothetical protein
MVFNATFNNISVISSQSDLLEEETGVPRENHSGTDPPQVTDKLYHIMLVLSTIVPMTQSDCIHVPVHPPFVCLLKIYWLRASACVIAYSMQSYIVYHNKLVGSKFSC